MRTKLNDDFIKSEREREDALSVSELNELCGNSGLQNAGTNDKTGIIPTEFEISGKSIDFVLAYDDNVSHVSPKRKPIEEQNEIRDIFENNLRGKGLELEKELVNGLTFVKIHAPRLVLRKYCEILKLKMPLKQIEIKEEQKPDFNVISEVKTVCKKFIRYFVTIDPHTSAEDTILYAEYSTNRCYMFDDNNPKFFTPTARMLVVDFIIHQTKWTTDEKDLLSIGIQTLLDQNIYKAAYPLHDGGYRQEGTLRNQLRTEWASMDKWIRLQPIDDIKEYLGEKNAFYFAWLGFYTQLLIPASIFGILVFVYGSFFLSGDKYSSYVCANGSEIMCPLCDQTCDYWKLNETCLYAKITYLFSNNFTVVFAFLMSVWATLFLELWKRHAAVLKHQWGLSDYSTESEHPRPQYLAQLAGAKKIRTNPETNQREPVLSFWFYKLPTVVFSYTLVIFFILVVFAVVLSISLYRMWMHNVGLGTDDDSLWDKYCVVPVTAGVLNLISIMILNAIYQNVAHYLTSLELPRTQTDFENSLSIKLYIFQFVNYYASIMYIAFFKGKFVGYPGDFNRVMGFRQEECNAGGCLIELSIQLAIIMVGQQILNSAMEMLIPAGWRWFNHYKLRKNDENVTSGELRDMAQKQWCNDYNLSDWGMEGLFSEYLEIATQFGFVTLFASSFPLAPLLALINNVFELRLDAQKILKYYRRPVPYQVPNIGVWYRITDVMGKMAVLFNAAIIAFSSDFIPRIVHYMERSDAEFARFGVSNFNTTQFPNISAPLNPSFNTTECWYYAYREPAGSRHEYDHTTTFWKILAVRLLFVLIFQNTVFIVKTGIQWIIPDVPVKLEARKKREARLVTELMIQQETEKALNDAAQNDVKAEDETK